MSADTAKEKNDVLPRLGRIEFQQQGGQGYGVVTPYSVEAQILAELRAIKSLLEKLVR